MRAITTYNRVMTIDGYVATEFEPVLEVFAQNFDERGEVGAAVCVYLDGQPVVDLWGGLADATNGVPWQDDTITLVYSATKGVTSVCANLLVQRGQLDPEATVASIWPEFAANGKQDITVAQVMSHQAGLPMVEGDFTLEETLAWKPMVEALAGQKPIWAPGTKHGYHMRTFGWLVGEICRRADNRHRTVGDLWLEEIADPLGIDFWIGLPEELEPRVARLVPPKDDLRELLKAFGDDLLLARVFSNPGGHFNYDEMWNTRQLHAPELPSSNGIGNARGLARLYASCIAKVEGRRTLSAETVANATLERACGKDEVLMIESCFGLGFMLGRSFGAANPPDAFGHAGAGGSLAFADPDSGISFAYVMNDLRFNGPEGDPRSEELVRAVYRSLELET
jgi:CubicO group peptidase (beta-lactamase class C family)